MPICIECRYPVPQLYHVFHSSGQKSAYSTTKASTNANSKSSATPSGFVSPKVTNSAKDAAESKPGGVVGGDVRLTQCPRCKRFADKYVEHDFVVLFIDLVLVKPQVYRHLLFNRLGRDDDRFDVCAPLICCSLIHRSVTDIEPHAKPSIIRLGTLLLLFDVYITWSSIESLPVNLTASSPVPSLPILLQYAFYLILCTLTTLAQHLSIRTLAGTRLFTSTAYPTSPTMFHASGLGAKNAGNAAADNTASEIGYSFRPNAISTAIWVSSCMKLFPILMVVWKYDDVGGQVGLGVQWAVALQNLEALRILLGCSYLAAGSLVGAGAVGRCLVGRLVLGAFGLGEVSEGLAAGAA
ncbi:sterol homeostasis protein [Lambiella insularis]|nr:sterol homeostasis protein [Lambiella insularis]